MSSVIDWFASSEENSGTWQMIGESAQGLAWNSCVGIVTFCTATGSHMWLNGNLNNYFKPAPRTVQDIAINIFSCGSTALLGGYVGECIGYSAVPLAESAGIAIDPAWIGLLGAAAASTTASWLHHCREAPAGKKGKKP